MPRPPRIDYPGAWHHVWQRGARREAIFMDDGHCLLFFKVLDRAASQLGLEIHAFALLPNHYHLLVRTPDGTLSRCMQQIGAAYTQEMNGQYNWDGSLFRGRFKNQNVENESYLTELLAYIHLNPVRARLVRRPEEECWTSHQAYLGISNRPRWLVCDVLLEQFGGAKALSEFVLRRHLKQTAWPSEMDLETGWLRLLAQKPEGMSAPPSSIAPRKNNDSEEILKKVFKIAEKTLQDLMETARGPGANPARRFAVVALAKWTYMTQKQIGARLEMSPNQVQKIIARQEQSSADPVHTWMQQLANEVLNGGV